MRFAARIGIVPALVVALSLAAFAAGPQPAGSPEQQVRAVLDAQVAAWNRGDLAGFMSGYWNDPALTFYSGTSVLSGWQATLERYQKRYQAPGSEMGKLDFSQLEIHALGNSAAWVGGHWHLKMSDGKDLGGVFTLIFRKTPAGWKIVHDHTS
jgi:ketosteroid isomerase-like protein